LVEAIPPMTVAKEPGHRGEHEAAVKTIARGMPGDSGVTVVTNARVYYTTRAAAGASGARHSLRPRCSEGGMFLANLAQNTRRDREAVSQHGKLFET
jgi:hypothetical protein